MTHPHGLFTWADLGCPDPDGGKAFYTSLFGWTVDELPPEAGGYAMFRKDGKLVAGIGPQQDPDQPTMWSSYVNVDDVDEIARRAPELGATLFMEPMQVMTAGRMCFLADPSGAAVGFWQPGEHTGAEAFNTPGAMTWNELMSRDVDAAIAFYAALLPWDIHPETFDGGFVFNTIMLGDRANGGIYAMPEQMPADVPSHWTVYFRVGETDASVERVQQLGGTLSGEPRESPFGKVATVTDPFGATFQIIGPAPQQ